MVDGVLVSNYALYSTTLEDTYARHAWLPWERMMNFFNCFRYSYGLQLETMLPTCPTWLCPQEDVPATLMVRFVWCAADLFIVQPIGFFADAAAAFTSSSGGYVFSTQLAAWVLAACCVCGRAATIVKRLADETGGSILK